MKYQPPESAIELVFQDEDILVVNKPAGLLSVPGRIHKDCLISRLQTNFPDVRCVHRLDMETSGLMVLALHKPAQVHLNKQFEQRRISKRYLARVIGVPETQSDEINLPLICDWPNRPRQKVDYDLGKQAQTYWQVKQREGYTSLIDLQPVTGRSHQLRVHLWHIGLPIVADSLYQPESMTVQQKAAVATIIKQTRRQQLHLHSYHLSFDHPGSGNVVSFNRPADFV